MSRQAEPKICTCDCDDPATGISCRYSMFNHCKIKKNGCNLD